MFVLRELLVEQAWKSAARCIQRVLNLLQRAVDKFVDMSIRLRVLPVIYHNVLKSLITFHCNRMSRDGTL
mgnify:CR=1 FL=1